MTNLAAFVGDHRLLQLDRQGRDRGLRGLAERAPFLALCLTIALFSLAGMPLFAGFATKFILFQAAAEQDMLWLAGVAVVLQLRLALLLPAWSSARCTWASRRRRRASRRRGWSTRRSRCSSAGVFFVGLYPKPVFDVVEDSTDTIFAAAAESAAVSR